MEASHPLYWLLWEWVWLYIRSYYLHKEVSHPLYWLWTGEVWLYTRPYYLHEDVSHSLYWLLWGESDCTQGLTICMRTSATHCIGCYGGRLTVHNALLFTWGSQSLTVLAVMGGSLTVHKAFVLRPRLASATTKLFSSSFSAENFSWKIVCNKLYICYAGVCMIYLVCMGCISCIKLLVWIVWLLQIHVPSIK